MQETITRTTNSSVGYIGPALSIAPNGGWGGYIPTRDYPYGGEMSHPNCYPTLPPNLGYREPITDEDIDLFGTMDCDKSSKKSCKQKTMAECKLTELTVEQEEILNEDDRALVKAG